MPFCKLCKNDFDRMQVIDGILKDVNSRSYCLSCKPEANKKQLRLLNRINKICTICKLDKAIVEFYKKSNGYQQSECKKCSNIRIRKRRLSNKLKCIAYKGGECNRCKYKKCVAALEFHHPENKQFEISEGIGKSFESLKIELDKCELLCSNCHREVEYTSDNTGCMKAIKQTKLEDK